MKFIFQHICKLFNQVGSNGECMQNCSVCGKTTETSTALASTTVASSLTFSQVLDKLVKEEQLAHPDFSTGIICTICKYFVSTLVRLQEDVVEVKTLILSLFKNEYSDIKSGNKTVEEGNIEVYQPNAGGTKKKMGTAEVNNESETLSIERINIEPNEKQNKEESKANSRTKCELSKGKKSDQAPQNTLESNRITRKSKSFNENKPKETKAAAKRDKINTTGDEVFYVESLLEKRGYKYFVKWENYPESYNSWEPRFGLPEYIVKVDSSLYCYND